MEPLPKAKISFSIVSREESNQKNGSISNVSNKGQTFSFVGKFNDPKRLRGRNQNLQCKHYGIKGHTIGKCYKLVEFPKDIKPKIDFNKSSGSVLVVASHVCDISCSSSFALDKLD